MHKKISKSRQFTYHLYGFRQCFYPAFCFLKCDYKMFPLTHLMLRIKCERYAVRTIPPMHTVCLSTANCNYSLSFYRRNCLTHKYNVLRDIPISLIIADALSPDKNRFTAISFCSFVVLILNLHKIKI